MLNDVCYENWHLRLFLVATLFKYIKLVFHYTNLLPGVDGAFFSPPNVEWSIIWRKVHENVILNSNTEGWKYDDGGSLIFNEKLVRTFCSR